MPQLNWSSSIYITVYKKPNQIPILFSGFGFKVKLKKIIITAISMGAISLIEPQHPKKDMTKMTAPIAMAAFAAER